MASRHSSMSAEEARRAELQRALGLLQSGKDPVEILAALSRRLTNKLLHAPLKAASRTA